MRLRRVLLAGVLVVLGLWLGYRAVVDARLDRDLLARELGRVLGQPVTLQDFELGWDGSVRLDEMTVGDFLKVRRAQTVLPWWEIVQGQVRPRRLLLSEPDLKLTGRPDPATPRPDFPIAFEGGTLRWEGHPPLQPLSGEWYPDGRLEVSHPQLGTWRYDGSRLVVEGVSLKALAYWSGHSLPLEGQGSAVVTPGRAELKTPYGDLTLTQEGTDVLLESPRLSHQEYRLQNVRARLKNYTELEARADSPWGPVTARGRVTAQGPDLQLGWANIPPLREVQVDVRGTWARLAFSGQARLERYRVWGDSASGRLELRLGKSRVGLARLTLEPEPRLELQRLDLGQLQLSGLVKRHEGHWQGHLQAPAVALAGVSMGRLHVTIAHERIQGQLGKLSVQGHWKGSLVHLELKGMVLDVDVATGTGTLEVAVPARDLLPAARMKLGLERAGLTLRALELAGIKPALTTSGGLDFASGKLAVELGFRGQPVTVKGVRGRLFGKARVQGSLARPRLAFQGEVRALEWEGLTADKAALQGSGPPWRGEIHLPRVKVDRQKVTGTLDVKARLPRQVTFRSQDLRWDGHSLGPVAGNLTGLKIELQKPLTLQGQYLPKVQQLVLGGPIRKLSLKQGVLSGKLALRLSKAGLQGSLDGQVANFQAYGLTEAAAQVKAVQLAGKPLSLTVRLPKPMWHKRLYPALRAQLTVNADNTTVDALEISSEPPILARGLVTHQPFRVWLRSELKAAPLALLPYPVSGAATGNLTLEGQTLKFAGSVAELEGWGYRLGSGQLDLNLASEPLTFSCQGRGFDPGRLNFLADRYPGLHGSLSFQATEKAAEVQLEGLVQGQQPLPALQAWLKPSGEVEKLIAQTKPPLQLAGHLKPLALQGTLTGQSLSELLRLAGGRPNPEISMTLAGPVQLKGSNFAFEGTVQQLTYRGVSIGGGRLTLHATPDLDGRLVLDQPLPLAAVAAAGLGPPALRNPLVGILGQAVLSQVRLVGVRLQGKLEAPRLTPEFSGL